jgi:hypothetical protein
MQKNIDSESGFPQQYYTIKANRARSENPVVMGGVGGFCRIGGGGGSGRTAGLTLTRTSENLRLKTTIGLMWAATSQLA